MDPVGEKGHDHTLSGGNPKAATRKSEVPNPVERPARSGRRGTGCHPVPTQMVASRPRMRKKRVDDCRSNPAALLPTSQHLYTQPSHRPSRPEQPRMRGDATDPDAEHAICRVEQILDRQNTKQGLGFCVGQRVVDLKTLGNILGGIVGVATTAVPILFSLRPSTASIGDDVCSLTASEIATIQGTIQGIMMGHNESCAYNMTLNEILMQ